MGFIFLRFKSYFPTQSYLFMEIKSWAQCWHTYCFQIPLNVFCNHRLKVMQIFKSLCKIQEESVTYTIKEYLTQFWHINGKPGQQLLIISHDSGLLWTFSGGSSQWLINLIIPLNVWDLRGVSQSFSHGLIVLTASAINCVTFGEEFHSYILGEGDKSLIKVLCVEKSQEKPQIPWDLIIFIVLNFCLFFLISVHPGRQ